MDHKLLGIIYFVALSHGLMLAMSLKARSNAGSPSKWLIIICAIVCYKLYEGGVLYTGLYRSVVHTLDLIPAMVLFVGPLLWCYVRQVTGKANLSAPVLVAQFLPAIAIWLMNAPAVFQTSEHKIATWDHVLSNSASDLPWFYVALLLAIKVHLGTYLYLSWKAISHFKQAVEELRADNSKSLLTNMQFIVTAFFLLELLWVSLFLAQQLFAIGTLNSVSDIWLLFVAAMVLSIGYVGLQQPDLVFTPEECKLVSSQPSAKIDDQQDSNVKYLHSALPESTSDLLAKELETQIQTQQLYLNDKLTLTDLAKATNIKAHTLSQIINLSMKTNFYRLINSYRVQHAVEIIEDAKHNWSLERIALESGFSNRVTFNKSFKDIMGCTPSNYKRSLQNVAD